MVESPEEVAALYSSSTADGGGGGGGDGAFAKRKRTKRRLRAFSSPPPQEEEEDMAHCLILLAQGRRAKFDSRKLAGAASTATGGAEAAGIYDYECGTCSKRFPSFQALGGHRTSHKKPRLAASDMVCTSSASASLAVVPAAADVRLRLHECSICGSEFASGQALGGHMRRHRPAAAPTSSRKEEEEEKCVLLSTLDLNLPAPPDENVISRDNSPTAVVAFAAAAFADQRPMGLVGCHY